MGQGHPDKEDATQGVEFGPALEPTQPKDSAQRFFRLWRRHLRN
jgi:hypothetical protein